MKKLISVLLCLALVFSFAACGKGEEANTPDTSKPAVEDTEAATKVKISRGVILDDVYTNAFAGFKFTKPAEWVYLSDEEIAQTINAGQDTMDLNAIEQALANTASVYDMAAQDQYGNSVMVCYENTMITALREVSVDEYEQQLKSQLSSVENIEYEFISSDDVTLGGKTYRKIDTVATTQGVTLSQAYYLMVSGKYVVSVICTSTNFDISAMEALFSAV